MANSTNQLLITEYNITQFIKEFKLILNSPRKHEAIISLNNLYVIIDYNFNLNFNINFNRDFRFINDLFDILKYCYGINLSKLQINPLYINKLLYNIKKLSKVKTIDLSNLQLFDHHLHEIFNNNYNKFRNLTNLNLSYTLITNTNCINFLLKYNKLLYLNLSFTNISNVDKLSNIKYLNLSNIKNNSINKVVNVNSLGSQHTLNLSGLHLNSIKNLSNVCYLNLSNTNILDVSCLKNVIYLNISNTKITSVNKLNQLTHLDISNTTIKNISNLNKLEYLNAINSQLEKLPNTIKYSSLSCYITNKLFLCPMIKPIDLNITNQLYLEYFVDVSHIGSNSEVVDFRNLGIIQLDHLKSVKVLYLNGSRVKNYSTLTSLEFLDIDYYNVEIEQIKALPNLKILHIEFPCDLEFTNKKNAYKLFQDIRYFKSISFNIFELIFYCKSSSIKLIK
jgi:hypothetical protein